MCSAGRISSSSGNDLPAFSSLLWCLSQSICSGLPSLCSSTTSSSQVLRSGSCTIPSANPISKDVHANTGDGAELTSLGLKIGPPQMVQYMVISVRIVILRFFAFIEDLLYGAAR